MTPNTQTIIPPEKGWEPHALYIVDVSYKEENPVHRALFFTGFLNGPGKTPGGYHVVISIIGQEFNVISQVRYLKAIRKLAEGEELSANTYKLPKDLE